MPNWWSDQFNACFFLNSHAFLKAFRVFFFKEWGWGMGTTVFIELASFFISVSLIDTKRMGWKDEKGKELDFFRDEFHWSRMQWSEGKVWQLLQCMVQWEVSEGKGWWGYVQASLHSLQAGFKLKLSIKQPKQKIFRTKQYSLHSWSRIALCTFLHYPETQFHFCHYRDCVRDAIKRENINMDEV